MLKGILFKQRPDVLLEKMLDKAALTQRVIASNVANIGTPGYERLGVSFDEKLNKAMRPELMHIKRTDPRHLPDPHLPLKLRPEVAKVENGYWNGINNVNIDQEMVDLAKNQLDFNIAAKIKSIRINQLRTAIRGRR
ncbi:flagellar basal body rod protein FlgB [Candidatus Latescibacterota bacterium]